ncbi:flavodoxin [Anaerolentibacter hominis]|uniref:flavodoxin n=1 Tax=Anaerolentibacter hominis TaxID=3079009 RepID=UPI0031B80F23
MKKTVVMLLVFVLLFSLTACSRGEDTGENTKPSDIGQISGTDVPASQPGDQISEEDETIENNGLVIYFSCTGNTEAVANMIAEKTGAAMYEIIPEQLYSEEDIDYQNDECRANQEMKDDTARPAISGDRKDLTEYDTLYVGYPIWWGTMPKIMNTFFDTYDLSGKTILPFCTSGGSGISESVAAVREAEPDAEIKEGLQIRSSDADDCAEAVTGWLEDNK